MRVGAAAVQLVDDLLLTRQGCEEVGGLDGPHRPARSPQVPRGVLELGQLGEQLSHGGSGLSGDDLGNPVATIVDAAPRVAIGAAARGARPSNR